MNVNNKKSYDENFILKKIAISLAEEDSRLFDELENDNTIINPKQEELDKRILTMINEHFNQESKINKIVSSKKQLMKVAIIVLVVLIGFIIPFTTVDEFRLKVLNFFIDNSETYSSFTPSDENTLDSIVIGYIPEGYKLTDKYKTSSSVLMSYIKYNNNTIDITFYNHDTTVSVDTENCERYIVNVNNENGYIYKKTNYVIFLYKFHGDTITIQSNDNLSNNELLKIADSIK